MWKFSDVGISVGDLAKEGGPMSPELKEPDPTQTWVRILNDWAEVL
jgi:hypothetical protein